MSDNSSSCEEDTSSRDDSVSELDDGDTYEGYRLEYQDLEKEEVAVSYGVDWHNSEVDPSGGHFWPVSKAISPFFPLRIGREIRVLRLQIRGTLFVDDNYQPGSGVRAPQVRLILYMDKSTEEYQMQGEDVMEASYSILAPVAMDTFQRKESIGKVVILYDHKFVFNGWPAVYSTLTGNVINSGVTIPFEIDYSFDEPLRVHFLSAGTAVRGNTCHLLAKTDYNGVPIYIRYVTRCTWINPYNVE